MSFPPSPWVPEGAPSDPAQGQPPWLLDAPSACVRAHVRLACRLTGWPVALLSFDQGGRQWLKAVAGLPFADAALGHRPFCELVQAADGQRPPQALVEVPDARLLPQLQGNPLVQAGLVSAAVQALQLPGGPVVGALCVLHSRPARLPGHQREALAALADDIVQSLHRREDLASSDALQALVAREADSRVRATAQAIPHMVWAILPDGRTEFCNRRWYAFTGLPEVATPDNLEWVALVHPDDRPRVLQTWAQAQQTASAYVAEFRLRHHSGDYRWVLDRAAPQRDVDGRLVRWIGTSTDVNEHHLQREASHRKDEFLAMLGHELRNPLAPVGYATAVLQAAPGDAAQVARMARVIDRQVSHMTTLIDDLLDVSRVTRGLIELDDALLDMRQVVQRALEQVQPLIHERAHQVQLALPGQLLPVRGDAVRLTQVVTNLLNNAAKYTPQGGLLMLSLAPDPAGQARLTVRDNGQGIEASLLPQLFELFTQGRRTPDRAQGGLGLGLSLAKRLMELHGGQVQAHSEGPGQGSVFTVLLPLAQASEQAAGSAAPAAAVARPRKVMVVDDNADAARAVGLLLEFDGHAVRVITDAHQALAAAQAEPAEFYILDIGLPEMDGYELARRLRADARTCRATLVALTGYGQAHDKTLALEAGFDHHLVKPGDPKALQRLLAEA